MSEKTNKIKSEFEQKYEESQQAAPKAEKLAEPAQNNLNSEAIPVVEEQLEVEKKTVPTGRVKISKEVNEEDVTVDVPMMHEEVDVERVAVNQYVDSPPPAVRHEGEKMIIPVLREEVVVQKRLLLVEELHVTKRQVQTQESQKATLRKEKVNVERVDLRNDSDQA
ncbi:uncharacterized protein (TIGR02271 family) [Pontibacter ummariensis]|uniref:Conserved domain-containing protein n=1 Tax=Pontibacter ummariensis TaxID=1610492 RepID=A0A239F9V0_9BACT|nr:YsnF/AvaK domain-containing protein [Pontibacter ummariensis]PRY12356.1 uncharacterized protein (TIGR02271 family) [Pontibacter ummariensis]SNS53669.1 conserved domain-containing protein [Pontibacter ummariensis]